MSVRSVFLLMFLVLTGLLAGLLYVSYLSTRNQSLLAASEVRRFESYKLAGELRRSSDDLTRLARTYVVTGDATYETYFYDVLAIRNGEKPKADGEREALRDLMRKMDFTAEEFAKLDEAQSRSDQLVRLEEKAMNAVKGKFATDTGSYTVTRKPDMSLARQIMHGQEYHKAKSEIMQPISEFIAMVDARTASEVIRLRDMGRLYAVLMLGMAGSGLAFTLGVCMVLYRRFVVPVRRLVLAAKQVGQGRYGERIEHDSADELGKLSSAFNQMSEAIERDIQEREKTAQQLRRLSSAVEQSASPVLITDVEGHIEYVNPSFTMVAGYTAEEVLGENPRILKTKLHPAEFYAELWDTITAGREWRGEFCNCRKDDSTYWVSAAISPIRDRDGKVVSFLGVMEDTTERKRAEAELIEARQVADAANRAKSEFLSHMSHELRTPLTGVLGYSQILQRDPEATENQKASLDAIVNCGTHLLSLINDVLDLSKIEAGRLDVDESPCDLSKLIKSVGNVVEQRASMKGLTFETEVAPEVPQGIVTDEAKLRQILVNLLSNAVKFTAEGGVVLRVSESPKGRLRFDVEDTGVGMSETDLAGVFDPFKQLAAGKAAGGTGLGLAISQRITERLGGRIDVKSQKGKGSTFMVDLPLLEADADDLGSFEAEGMLNYGAAVLARGQKCTILIADDRETNRDILQRMLIASGIVPLVADDGDTALEMLREHKEVDLVLMDVRMPRLNGIEAVKLIRADQDLKHLKVVAVTASVFPEFKAKAIEAGFDDFLGKPFRTEELFNKLSRHLRVEFVVESETADGVPEVEAAEDISGELAARTADRIREAIKLGNITALNRIAAELESEDGAAWCGRRIAEFTRAFDFAALNGLADQLTHPTEEQS